VAVRALDTELPHSHFSGWAKAQRREDNIVEQNGLGRCGIRRWEVSSVQGANKELWRELCEQAAVEQDPKKLLELTKQINELLEAKQGRLNRATPSVTTNGSK
jgi:hypothetical protein